MYMLTCMQVCIRPGRVEELRWWVCEGAEDTWYIILSPDITKERPHGTVCGGPFDTYEEAMNLLIQLAKPK